MLGSSFGRKIASLSHRQLFSGLINDAYKPKMHKIYSNFLRGVKVDFALNVRKSPFALKRIEQEVCPHATWPAFIMSVLKVVQMSTSSQLMARVASFAVLLSINLHAHTCIVS